MNACQALILVGGSLALLTAAFAVMIRLNESERRQMERRREAWIADGCIPEDQPNFYSGNAGSA
jgi:hypothetical protein